MPDESPCSSPDPASSSFSSLKGTPSSLYPLVVVWELVMLVLRTPLRLDAELVEWFLPAALGFAEWTRRGDGEAGRCVK